MLPEVVEEIGYNARQQYGDVYDIKAKNSLCRHLRCPRPAKSAGSVGNRVGREWKRWAGSTNAHASKMTKCGAASFCGDRNLSPSFPAHGLSTIDGVII
jgi:hypothetical protein